MGRVDTKRIVDKCRPLPIDTERNGPLRNLTGRQDYGATDSGVGCQNVRTQ